MAQKRLAVIRAHIESKVPQVPLDSALDQYRARTEGLAVGPLREFYFGDSLQVIERILARLAADRSMDHYKEFSLGKSALRERTLRKLTELYDPTELHLEVDQRTPEVKVSLLYGLQCYDQALSTVLIVHLVLYTDTLQALGTAKHREFIHRAYALEDYGCFAMTELGHGSNLAALETTATYDAGTREFIVNSPTTTAAKWWIGALAKNANRAVVFARLIVDTVDRGIHVFLVTIRDAQHNPVTGVVIGDCGEKIGLHGIDNGYILFKGLRVPYDSLLNRYSEVTPQGKYKSSIKSNAKRLGIQLAGLIRGRLCSSMAAEINLREGLTIALRYSALRRQFGETGAPETPILDYQLQRMRLIPHLAKTFAQRAAHLAMLRDYKEICVAIAEDPECDEVNEYHAHLSAVKAISGWYTVTGLQDVRECTGGHGYSVYSSLNRLRMNSDVLITWEGENKVLIQQTSKFLLKQVQNTFKGRRIYLRSLQFIKLDFGEIKLYNCKFNNTEELLNEETLVEMLEYRCNYLLHTSLQRLQENPSISGNLTEAWNHTQSYYLFDLAIAFGELFLAECFRKRLAECSSDTVRQLAHKYFSLFVVTVLAENLATFYEFCLTPAQATIVKNTQLKLVDELCEVSVRVVDALAPPDRLLGSTLGVSSGQVYQEIINSVENESECYTKAKWFESLILPARARGRAARERIGNK